MTMVLNFRPRPVSVTTPTMRPAPAQVAATFRTPIDPPSMALMNPEPQNFFNRPGPRKESYEIRAVSRRRKLVKNETTVAQNTDSTGEKPHSMKKTMETSDRKWNQYLRVRFQTESTFSMMVLPMPFLRASISTIRNSAK